MFRRMLANAIARRLAYVLVALLFAWLGLGQARASDHTSRADAWAHLTSEPLYTNASYCEGAYGSVGGHTSATRVIDTASSPWATMQFERTCARADGSTIVAAKASPHRYPYAERCIAPLSTDKATGQCKNPADVCLERNNDAPSSNTAIYTGDKCIDGCMWGKRPQISGDTQFTDGGGASVVIAFGKIGFTGQTCTTPSPDAPNPKQENKETCRSAGGGMTMCVKQDGRHCYSASGPGAIVTSREICWSPGETGTKTDGPTAQVRKPGNPPVTPPTPPPGDTFTDGNNNATATTHHPDGHTSTTTTNNYYTGSGTDAGENQGQDTTDDGSGEGDQGSASGGEGCDVPPTCQGDAIGCATLVQVWRNRCSPNKNKIEGGGECDANGNPVLVCSGDQVMCKQTLYQAQQYCLAKKGDANGDGQPDWTKPGPGDGTEGAGEDPGVGEVVRSVPIGTDRFDESGFLGDRACPTMGTLDLGDYGTFDLDQNGKLCDLLSAVKFVLILVASFMAFRILSGAS